MIIEGHMIYYGPTTLAVEYFVDMGFEPKHRQTVADFLVIITDPFVSSLTVLLSTRGFLIVLVHLAENE